MYKLKEWYAGALTRSKAAIQVLVQGEISDDLTVELADLKKEHDIADSLNVPKENRTTIEDHICMQCREPSFHCVVVNGSSVDLLNKARINNNQLEKNSLTVEASTQTFLIHSSPVSALPDLLSSTTSTEVEVSSRLLPVPPPPAPPPPPPPLIPPTLLSSAWASKQNSSAKKKTVKKRKSGGLPVAPEITAEALKNVKLKKPEERVLRSCSQSNADESPSEIKAISGQPAITLGTLQKVSLRKAPASSSKNSSPQNENIECRPGEVFDVKRFLKRTRLDRSPGGTPIPFNKRKKQPLENHTPVSKK